MASSRIAIAAGLVVALLSACCGGSPAPGSGASSADLHSCPRGDKAWRAALGGAANPQALAELEQVTRDAARSCPERWEPRWAAAETLFRRSSFDEARPLYEQALELARGDRDSVGVACASNRLGSLHYFRAELPQARERFEEALAAARAAQRGDLAAFVLNNLAGLLKETGELSRAALLFDEAVAALRALGLGGPARAAAYNAAALRLNLGDMRSAQDALTAVVEEAGSAADAEVLSSASIALGNLHLARGDARAARGWFERATADSAPVRVSRDVGLGRAALALADPAEAGRRLAAAATLAREKGLVLDALLAEIRRAEAWVEEGRSEEALRSLAATAEEARRVGSVQYALWLAHAHLGRAHLARRETGAAVTQLREAVRILESQSERLSAQEEGLHFLLDRADPYVDLAVALAGESPRGVRGAPVAEILDAAERAHARMLRRTFGARFAPSASARIEAIRGSLAADEMLLDSLIGQDHGVLIAITRTEAVAIRIAGWKRLAPALSRWRAALSRPLAGSFVAVARPEEDLARDLDAGRALFDALLDPVSEQLAHVRRLWIVPDRQLALLPFAALPRAGARTRFLGEDVEIVLLPVAGPVPRSVPIRGPILLAGNPLPDSGGAFPALPRARQELDGIASVWQDVVRIEAVDLTRATLAARLASTYGAVHLATHAVASSLDPRKCAVVLSQGELLGFDAVAALTLDGALVVLSACRSGEGETIPGQGVVGLGWAFLLAGARGLTVSLWQVDDAAAADLMIEMHRALRAGDDPVRALAVAQAAVRRQKPHPAYWAPFVVYLEPEAESVHPPRR